MLNSKSPAGTTEEKSTKDEAALGQDQLAQNHMLAAVFFKCQTNDWSSFEKGKIYHKETIGKYLIEYPNDFKPVLDYPNSKEIIDCILKGKNKIKILKALRQWSSVK